MKFTGLKINQFAAKLPLGRQAEDSEQAPTSYLHLDPCADIKAHDAFGGLIGSFATVKNDFSFSIEDLKHYRDHEGDENESKTPATKHVRFLICTLALAAMTLSLTTRIILNVSIVEMTKSSPNEPPIEYLREVVDLGLEEDLGSEGQPVEGNDLRFDWSVRSQNMLISAFYYGYGPSMLLSGGLAESYGSKYLLIICIAGSGAVSMLTPLVAGLSLPLLICLRVLLGVLQGGLIPASYDLFNKWLTLTETSIFVPLIKVGLSFGVLIGSMLPGLTKSLGYNWTGSFYLAGCICFIWTLAWCLIASSSPKTNRLVGPAELKHIERKKPHLSTVSAGVAKTRGTTKEVGDKQPIPWFAIISNPSVLALILVKFTYNIGMDFMVLKVPMYLKNVHKTDIEVISLISTGGALLQMVLITFVGWAAKELIQRKTLGLSRTKWRKAFQGFSNFTIGTAYLLLPYAGHRLDLAITLIILVYFLWMFGAGGEAMVPYDLSAKYPAFIAGVAQAVSVLSGIAVPILHSLVVGEEGENLDRWSDLFRLFGGGLYLGGLVFVFVLKAKPFLPSERSL